MGFTLGHDVENTAEVARYLKKTYSSLAFTTLFEMIST